MNKKYLLGIVLVFFLSLVIPVESTIWCANNDSATIELFEICLNETEEPCLGCTVNLTIYNPNFLGINYTTLLNESGYGWYNTTITNPLRIAKYPMHWVCNDSENIYGRYDYNILEIMDVCPGYITTLEDILQKLRQSQALNWTEIQANFTTIYDYLTDNIQLALQGNWSYLYWLINSSFNCTAPENMVICNYLSNMSQEVWYYPDRNLTWENQSWAEKSYNLTQLIGANQTEYFPNWNATFYFWNNTFFLVWNNSLYNLNTSFTDTWNYFNCTGVGANNMICMYLINISQNVSSIFSLLNNSIQIDILYFSNSGNLGENNTVWYTVLNSVGYPIDPNNETIYVTIYNPSLTAISTFETTRISTGWYNLSFQISTSQSLGDYILLAEAFDKTLNYSTIKVDIFEITGTYVAPVITPPGPDIGPAPGGDIIVPVCGNGECEPTETKYNCPQDCAPPNTTFTLKSYKTKLTKLYPGFSGQFIIIIINNQENSIEINVESLCLKDNSCSWITFFNKSKTIIEVPEKSNVPITIDVNIPNDILYKDYSSMIVFDANYTIIHLIGFQVEYDIFRVISNFLNTPFPKLPENLLGLDSIPLWFWFLIIIVILVGTGLYYKRKRKRIKEWVKEGKGE